MFDLPTETKAERKMYAQFRKKILADGFQMFQFSMYIRHCSSKENADVHIQRVKKILPAKGHIGILNITDKQFSMMEIFRGKDIEKSRKPCNNWNCFKKKKNEEAEIKKREYFPFFYSIDNLKSSPVAGFDKNCCQRPLRN